MALLIDGHNVIGAGVFDDIQLSDEDDEAKFVARLKVWRSRYRGNITVVFDRGIPGGVDRMMSGAGVEVIFASDPAEADDLIRRRLENASSDLELVSNDVRLLSVADANGVSSLRATEFVERFAFDEASVEELGAEADIVVSDTEVEEWLGLFEEAKPPSSTRRFSRKLRPRKRR